MLQKLRNCFQKGTANKKITKTIGLFTNHKNDYIILILGPKRFPQSGTKSVPFEVFRDNGTHCFKNGTIS